MPASPPLRGPPAIWTAFATQGRWKNWLLLGQLALNFALLGVAFALARRAPDVIVVSPDGAGSYVEASVAGAALQSYLREQRGKPSDLTVRAFTERFVRLTAAVNSTTFDEAWAEAQSLMVAPLAAKLADEARAQKLLETYRLAQVRTTLAFEALDIIERRGDKTHVRARVTRHREKLTGGSGSDDTLQVDLVLLDVPRSRRHPDGLEVLDWRSAPVSAPSSPPPAPAAEPSP